MKDVIKLTTVSGEPLYIREGYSITAVIAETTGEIKLTGVYMDGIMFRVREPADKVAEMLGWEPKKSTP